MVSKILFVLLLISSQLFSQTNALHFAGTGSGYEGANDYISIPDNGTLDLGNNFSIEAWVFLDDAKNNTIIDKGNYRYLFQVHANERPGLGLYNTKNEWVYSEGSVPTNQWVHVAVTVDGSNVVFYLNGNILSAHAGFQHVEPDNGEISIGMQSPESCRCNFFDGKMCELRIWGRTISQTQIQSYMNVQLGSSGMENLQAIYNFHQGSANYSPNTDIQLRDGSVNNNHGELKNFTMTGSKSNWVTGRVFTGLVTPVTGHNVNMVDYSNSTGKFIMERTSVWREIGTDGTIYNFSETARTEQTIFLKDESRGIHIELDIMKGHVNILQQVSTGFRLLDLIKVKKTDKRKLYDINIAYNTANSTTREYINQAPSAPPSPPADNRPYFEVFEDANFGGRSLKIYGDWQFSSNPDEWNQWNDRISSIKLPDGWGIQLFSDNGYKGESKIITSNLDYSLDQALWNQWNDRISSIKCAPFINTAGPSSPASTNDYEGLNIEPGTEIIEEDVPDMPDSDLNAILAWIKNKTIGVRMPYCYRQSYERGAGVIANSCPSDKDKDGELCYPRCRDGYGGAGPVCWQRCPDGFRDDGAFCGKPKPYGRGTGFAKRKNCEEDNSQGCEKNGLRYYPKCRYGYKSTGCCICSPRCPDDFGTDIGVSCTKKTYTRGAGTVLECPSGTIRDETGGPLGLCYPRCRDGFHGVGPVCWQSCPPDWVGCGVGCAKSKTECGTATFDQVWSSLILAANIATLGMSSSASTASNAVHAAGETAEIAGKTVTGTTRLGRALVKIVNKLQSINPSGLAKDASIVRRIYHAKTATKYKRFKTVYKTSKVLYRTGKDYYRTFTEDFIGQTSKEINAEIDNRFHPQTANYIKESWANIQLAEMLSTQGFATAQTALMLVSIVDISGVTGVISAFTKPQCQEVIPFPNLSQPYK